MLLKLKAKMVELHGSQIVASKAVGIEATRLSRIVRQHIEPRKDERARLVAAFGASSLRPSAPRSTDESEVG
jgi:hypothetical protein